MDLTGSALLVSAVATLIGVIGALALQVIALFRLKVVHDLTNSQSEKLNTALEKLAFAAGEKAERERAAAKDTE